MSLETANVFQMPDAAGEQIGLLDQTVVLANSKFFGRDFVTARPAHGVFSARTVQVGGPQGAVLTLPGTWASVDFVNTESPWHTFRFVSVHTRRG